jgi:hypothetical protein
MFGQRITSNDCITRLNDALDELASIRRMMSVAPAPDPNAEANRKRSLAHLADAWTSTGWALRAVWLSQHDRTRAEEVAASVQLYRTELAELQSEITRLEAALVLARAEAERRGASVPPAPSGRAADDTGHRLRRAVMGALHPDKAGSAAEGAWRTALCQTLFPEIDRILGGH